MWAHYGVVSMVYMCSVLQEENGRVRDQFHPNIDPFALPTRDTALLFCPNDMVHH